MACEIFTPHYEDLIGLGFKEVNYGNPHPFRRFERDLKKGMILFCDSFKDLFLHIEGVGDIPIMFSDIEHMKTFICLSMNEYSNNPVLHLPLKKEWYNMIDSGEKKEEYRAITPYWRKRIKCCAGMPTPGSCLNCPFGGCTVFKAVCFHYGYTLTTMTFCVESIKIGKGRPEWGAPDEDVFIIRLGKRIK